MSELYESDEKVLTAFQKLTPEYQRKIERQLKDLMKIQRTEQKIKAEIRRIDIRRKAENKDGGIRCSFCGACQEDAEFLISGDTGEGRLYICDECVDLCGEILKDARGKANQRG